MAERWGENEIIANLFVGDLQDAAHFDGIIISVLGRATLDSTAAVIDAALERNQRVLVHCEEGCERAPLVVAWFLKTRRGMTLDEAYALMKSRRPIVQDRRRWLGIYDR